jgi:hypothetical protein
MNSALEGCDKKSKYNFSVMFNYTTGTDREKQRITKIKYSTTNSIGFKVLYYLKVTTREESKTRKQASNKQVPTL